jgi:hypothetical protein
MCSRRGRNPRHSRRGGGQVVGQHRPGAAEVGAVPSVQKGRLHTKRYIGVPVKTAGRRKGSPRRRTARPRWPRARRPARRPASRPGRGRRRAARRPSRPAPRSRTAPPSRAPATPRSARRCSTAGSTRPRPPGSGPPTGSRGRGCRARAARQLLHLDLAAGDQQRRGMARRGDGDPGAVAADPGAADGGEHLLRLPVGHQDLVQAVQHRPRPVPGQDQPLPNP